MYCRATQCRLARGQGMELNATICTRNWEHIININGNGIACGSSCSCGSRLPSRLFIHVDDQATATADDETDDIGPAVNRCSRYNSIHLALAASIPHVNQSRRCRQPEPAVIKNKFLDARSPMVRSYHGDIHIRLPKGGYNRRRRGHQLRRGNCELLTVPIEICGCPVS